MFLLLFIILAVPLAFAVDLSPWLRGGYGWRWGYAPSSVIPAAGLALALAIYAVGAILIVRRAKRPRYALIWALFGTVSLSLVATSVQEGNALYAFLTRTVSITSSGEHWAGVSVDWAGGEWRDWTTRMAELGDVTSNAATIPPGLPLLYGTLTSVLEGSRGAADALYRPLLPYQCHNYEFLTYTPSEWGSAWLGILMPLWASLTVFPLYGIARRLAPATAPQWPVLWWPLVPGILAFAASSSTVFPFIAALSFWLLVNGMERRVLARRVLWLMSAGLIYGLGIFMNFVFLPIAPLFGLYVLFDVFRAGRARHELVRTLGEIGGSFFIGAALPWLVWFALTGETPLGVLLQALDYHLDLDRPYWYWVWMHLWDWAIWTSLLLVIVVTWGVQRWRGKHRERGTEAPAPVLSLALLLTVVIWTVSGTTRAESGRIWLLLAPFVLIAAAETVPLVVGQSPSEPSGHEADHTLKLKAISVWRERLKLSPWPTWLAVQTVFTFVLIAFVPTYSAPDLSYPPTPSQYPVTQAVDATFADHEGPLYRLTGWDAKLAENNITLSLQWQGVNRPLQYQWFNAILVAPDGSVYPTEPWQPATSENEPIPTTCWDRGRVIGDKVELPLPDGAVSGDWYISLSAFGDDTLPDGRLRVVASDGSLDSQVGLGPVTVP